MSEQVPDPAPGEDEVEGGEGVTMLDVLQEEEALEEDAAAVLGNVSDSSCSYSLGYLRRQPLYACRDCCREGESAGVCLACSYHCHEGCTLVELYTKRNFRCDCGTAKMSRSCRLEPGATRGPNTENRYNQNFSGVYCVCARPYPDPEDPVEDVMIQCVVCEDWFHGRHTRAQPLPAEDSYAEMICFGCVDTLGFLQSYVGLAVTSVKTVEEKDIPESKVEVEAAASTAAAESQDNVVNEPKAQTKSDSECKLKSRPSAAFDSKVSTSLFFPDKWRSALCKCPECIKMYKELNVEFLTEESDTVLSYESQAKEEKRTTVDQGMEALSQMDRVKQVEAIHSYNNMKTNLMEYLSKFADNKKVVREEDIREFFETMKNKKRKLDGGAPPSSCK